MALSDAYALAYLLEASRKCGLAAAPVSCEKAADIGLSDFLSIGGPSGNSVCASFLGEYCGGFKLRAGEIEGSDLPLYYQCGPHEFRDNERDAYLFIVKLAPDITGLTQTALFAWGHRPVGTAAAAFLVSHYPQFIKAETGKSFFLVAKISRTLGHRSITSALVDVTAEALGTYS